MCLWRWLFLPRFHTLAKRYTVSRDHGSTSGIVYNKFLHRIGKCIHGGAAFTHVPSKLRTRRVKVEGFGVTASAPSKGDGQPFDLELQAARNMIARVQALASVLTAAAGRQVVRSQLPQNRDDVRPKRGCLATEPFVQALRGYAAVVVLANVVCTCCCWGSHLTFHACIGSA